MHGFCLRSLRGSMEGALEQFEHVPLVVGGRRCLVVFGAVWRNTNSILRDGRQVSQQILKTLHGKA